MIGLFLKRIGWFVGLVLLQVLILNNIHIAGFATPILYLYFILKLPSSVSRVELICWGFFLGLSIDMFSNTPGMNASATTLLAFMRPSLIRLFAPKDSMDEIVPGIHTVSLSFYIKYTFTCVLIHTATLFVIEAFSFLSWELLLLKIGLSAVLTFIGILAIEGFNKKGF